MLMLILITYSLKEEEVNITNSNLTGGKTDLPSGDVQTSLFSLLTPSF